MRGIYRTRRNLRWKKGVVGPGVLLDMDKPEEVIEKLLYVGAISKPRFPPMEVLPGWKDRAETFDEAGIEGVEEFLLMDPKEVVARMPEMTLGEVQDLKAEIRGFLQ